MAKLSTELDQFFAQTQREVDHALRALVEPHEDAIPNLDDATAYALGLDPEAANSGKRIRPALCVLVCHCLSGKTAPAVPFAAAIEFMHNFCLVHDDIEDGDEYRRGRPSVWKRYGLPHAINVGDYLFTKIFAALLMSRNEMNSKTIVRLFALMSATLDHTHRGQALDMNARGGPITVEQYMRLVTEKTGYYLAAPLVAGCIAAGGSQEIEETLNRFGLLLGPMFQIRDDLIDLTSGKGRDLTGSDICEGKRSFLVAHACRKAAAKDRAELIRILDLPREETTNEHIEWCTTLFGKCGAFDEANRICEELRSQAVAVLDPLPAKLAESLREVTAYLVDRKA